MAEIILKEAETFYITTKNSNRSISWYDYEYFKQRLHNEGLFGYESKLADILHL